MIVLPLINKSYQSAIKLFIKANLPKSINVKQNLKIISKFLDNLSVRNLSQKYFFTYLCPNFKNILILQNDLNFFKIILNLT